MPSCVCVKRLLGPARLPTVLEPRGHGENPGQMELEVPISMPLMLPGDISGKSQA